MPVDINTLAREQTAALLRNKETERALDMAKLRLSQPCWQYVSTKVYTV